MKMTIATIFLALAAGQASADRFYQQVASKWQQSNQTQEISEAATATSYTPLYLKVVGNSREAFNQGKAVIRTPSKTTYTPLLRCAPRWCASACPRGCNFARPPAPRPPRQRSGHRWRAAPRR